MELGEDHRTEDEARPSAIGSDPDDPVIDEIDEDLGAARSVRNQGGRKAARIHVERGMPGVVDPRRARAGICR